METVSLAMQNRFLLAQMVVASIHLGFLKACKKAKRFRKLRGGTKGLQLSLKILVSKWLLKKLQRLQP